MCAGIGFYRSKSLTDKFLMLAHFLSGFLAGRDWFQSVLALFGVGGVVIPWLVWALGGDLGCHFGSMCLVLCGRI